MKYLLYGGGFPKDLAKKLMAHPRFLLITDGPIARNKNWRSLGELRLEFFEPPRSIEITVLAQFITFWQEIASDHMIQPLFKETNNNGPTTVYKRQRPYSTSVEEAKKN